MNKIIPFNKEIKFTDCIGEITSIALDDTLKFKDNYTITGDLIVRGCHKYNEVEEDFSYPIPTTIAVDEKYDTSNASIMVDDFYYEILNDDTLKVKIDLILDNLKFKEKTIEPMIEEIKFDRNDEIENSVLEDKENKPLEEKEKETIMPELFNGIDEEKEYSVYRVYTVVEGDTLSKILEKYNITSEELSHYNNLDNLKVGTKLIIPSIDE